MAARKTHTRRMTLVAAAFALTAFMSAPADADRCETRKCVEREIRKGYHDVQKEKAEARREVRRELREGDRHDHRPHR